MHILKSFLVWLLRALCVTAIVGMVYLATVSTTLLDRHDIKQWVGASGASDSTKLIPALFSDEAIDAPDPIISSQNLVSNETIKKAAERTFDKQFLQTSFDTVIDSSYDWMEGKSATFSFSVPLETKRQTFIAELSKEIQSQVATLPVCNVSSQSLCRPDSLSAEAFSQQIIADAIGQSDFLIAPLTEATFTTASQGQDTAVLEQLPQLRSAVTTLLWVLPFVIILSAIGAGLLTSAGSRLQLFIKLSREVFSSTLLGVILAGGVLILQQTRGIPIEQFLEGAGPLAPIMAAFVNQMISGFAWALLLFASIPFVLSIISWITLRVIKSKTQAPPEPPVAPTPQPPVSLPPGYNSL